jgi:PleD family two-component response regulator
VSQSSYHGDEEDNISVSEVEFIASGSFDRNLRNAAIQRNSDVRILIVDSAVAFSSFKDMIKMYFDSGGVNLSLDIVSATDELSALHLLNNCILQQENFFDFVIVNSSFDFTDGLAVVKKMKENPCFTACVIGLLAELSSSDLVADFLSCGANVVLTKPIDSDTLGKFIMDEVLASIFF